MKVGCFVLSMVAMCAPSFAQDDVTGRDPSAYVSALAGVDWSSGASTSSVLVEGGVRIAPHVMVFGTVGRLSNLQSGLQPTLANAASNAIAQGVAISGTGTLSAWHGLGGLRAEFPVNDYVFPYVLAGLGAAHLTPTAQFTFAGGGPLPDGSMPNMGDNVTGSLIANGLYAAPSASTTWMGMFGFGVQVPLASRFAVDLGYRYSRLGADAALDASALNTNALRFGFAYRF